MERNSLREFFSILFFCYKIVTIDKFLLTNDKNICIFVSRSDNMINSHKSIKLTRVYIIILTIGFIALLFSAPFTAFWYTDLTGKSDTAAKVLMGVFYLCSPAAAIVIISSLKLLNNMKNGMFFTVENTKHLSRMSWSCFYVTPICLIGFLWFYGFIPIAVSSAFMFLILRIIKNVFEYGCEIKEENDLMV